MTQETLKKMYQLLLTEPHAETVCFKLEAIAREALAQPPLPVQEPVAYDKTEMNSFVIDLYDKKMQEGKHGHYEIMFHVVHQAIKKVTLPLPVQPEQDFKTATKKEAALKQVIDLIQPVAALADRTPFEHSEVIQRCVDAVEIALEALAQPVQEPVAWDKPSASFNEWWDSYRHDGGNPFQTDSFAYWAFAGWKAALAQRQWVGLNDVDVKNLELTSATSSDVRNISAELKEKNT